MEDKPKVLVVDDDTSIRELIQVYLEDEFQVIHAASGTEAIELTKVEKPVLVVLDVMLPGKTGWEVCREVRTFSNTPIIMVTAKGGEVDRILGLELGADDYICKPFSPRELLARVKAQIRRSSLPLDINYSHMNTNIGSKSKRDVEGAELKFHGLSINLNKYKVILHGKAVDLTTREFQLLAFLAEHEGHVFSREQLLERVWGFDYAGDSRAVDSAIKRLRKKLNTGDNNEAYIHSIRSVGYKFEVGMSENNI